MNISKHFEVINLEAMNEEHDSTSRKHVAIFVPNKNVVSCKWVYQIKENHNILHFKARLIFQGFVSTYIHLVQKAKNDSTCLIIGNVISRLVHEKVKHPISPFAVRIYITIESDKLAIIFLIHYKSQDISLYSVYIHITIILISVLVDFVNIKKKKKLVDFMYCMFSAFGGPNPRILPKIH